MNPEYSANDLIHDEQVKPKLSSGLNVLTILTIIWCVIQALLSVWGYFSAQTTFEGRDKILEQMNSGTLPAWAKAMMGDVGHFEEMITKSYENRLPIMLLSLVAVGLCFMGALQMRKLKKQGFLFYTIGELLPFLTLYFFIGAFAFSGIGFMVSICIAVLFILMYALQRKNLVY